MRDQTSNRAYKKRHPEKVKEWAHNWYIAHKDKCSEWNKSYIENNKEKVSQYKTDWARKNNKRINCKKYGITAEDYIKLFELQNGVCAICGKSETRMVGKTVALLSIDHNHKTGKVRGLLCAECNWIIGKAEDNIEILMSAIQYLEGDLT